jgi:tetratricopeptide (TPR) repeat protein
MSLIGNFFGGIGYFNHMRSRQKGAEKYYRLGLKFGGMSSKNEGAFGVLLLKQGNFDEALEHFDNSLKGSKVPKSLQSLIRMNRAITWFRLGQTEKAIVTLEDLHKNFRSLRVYQTLGYVYDCCSTQCHGFAY